MSTYGLPSLFDLIKRPEYYIQGYPLKDWYRGVVEDNNDPEKRERVKVRVESIWKSAAPTNDDKSERVDVKNIPWAELLGRGKGYRQGTFDVPPVGTAVVVVFENGNPTHPMVIGTWYGMGPDGNTEIPLAARGGAIGKTDTASSGKGSDNATKAGGGSITEPANPYAAVYPNNRVWRSPAGLLVEFDDTSSAERINIAHISGTWWEIHPDGSFVLGIQGQRYVFTVGDDALHVKGSRDVVVDVNASRKVGGNLELDTVGNVNNVVGGTHDVDIEGNATRRVGGNLDLTTEGNLTDTVDGTATVDVTGTYALSVTAAATISSQLTLLLSALTSMAYQSPIHLIQGPAAAPATTVTVQSAATVVNAGGVLSPVVTGFPNGTHPVDFITGLPIVGLATFNAG